MPGLLIDKELLIKNKLYELLRIKKIPEDINNIGVIFLIKDREYEKIIKKSLGNDRINYIKSKEFYNSIIEVYYVIYNNEKKICEIRETIYNYEHLSIVVLAINKFLPKDIMIWTGVIEKDFEKYVKVGFVDPYITNKSPLNHRFNEEGVAFFKNNVPETDIDIKFVMNNVEYIKKNNLSKNCIVYARFTKSAVNFLKKINKPISKVNNKGNISQKELSGALVVKNILNINGQNIFELTEDPKSVETGMVEEVEAVWSRYNFHTHPKQAYINHNVTNGWPSCQDYIGFIDLRGETIFHTVVTLEGLYIISFSSYWVDKISQISKKFVIKKYDINHKRKISFQRYVEIVNNIKYKGKPLFVVKYMDWENTNQIFPAFYSKIKDTCVATEQSKQKIEKYV